MHEDRPTTKAESVTELHSAACDRDGWHDESCVEVRLFARAFRGELRAIHGEDAAR